MLHTNIKLSRAAFPEAPVREEELRHVIGWIRQGECCSVVAPSNMGKSHFLKSLLEEEVRQACALETGRAPVMVFVDCLEAGDSEHALYELLLRRIGDELEDSSAPPETVGTLRALHDEVLRTDSEISMRSLFATSIRELDHWGEARLVVILDEFDDMFSMLPPWPERRPMGERAKAGRRLLCRSPCPRKPRWRPSIT